MADTLHDDALTYEELHWRNWVDEYERTRDQEFRTLAAATAKTGTYLSGGRLKREVQIVFSGIGGVVTNAVQLRANLAAGTPSLCDVATLSALKQKLQGLLDAGVSFVQMRSGQPPFDTGVSKAITKLAREEANAVFGRATNELDAIPLAIKLGPKKETSSPANSITVHGNNNIVNLAPVIGDLDASVHVLQQSNQAEIAAAISALATAIQESAELASDSRRIYLEHLATVGEQAAKPSVQRRLATFTTALSGLSTLASVAEKAAPYYEQLIQLLKTHNILS